MLFSAVSDEIEIFSKWRCISSIVCVHSTIFIEQDLGSCIHIYDEFLNRLAFAGTATPAVRIIFFFFFFFRPFKSFPVPETIVRRYVSANKRFPCAGISFRMEDEIQFRDSLYLIQLLYPPLVCKKINYLLRINDVFPSIIT